MGTLIELTTSKVNLNLILQAVILNSTSSLINKNSVDIIAKDLLQQKPKTLVHCYTLRELVMTAQVLLNNKLKLIKGREIIPNNHNLGLVREIFIDFNSEKIKSNFFKKYRYYFSFEGEGMSMIVTYNPEIVNQKEIAISLGKLGVACCQVMQTKGLASREYKIEKEVKDAVGIYTIYRIDEEEQ